MTSAIFRVGLLVDGFSSKSTVRRICLAPQSVLFGMNEPVSRSLCCILTKMVAYVMGWGDAENVHDTCVVQLDHYVQLRRKLLTSRCTLQTCIQPSRNVHWLNHNWNEKRLPVTTYYICKQTTRYHWTAVLYCNIHWLNHSWCESRVTGRTTVVALSQFSLPSVKREI